MNQSTYSDTSVAWLSDDVDVGYLPIDNSDFSMSPRGSYGPDLQQENQYDVLNLDLSAWDWISINDQDFIEPAFLDLSDPLLFELAELSPPPNPGTFPWDVYFWPLGHHLHLGYFDDQSIISSVADTPTDTSHLILDTPTFSPTGDLSPSSLLSPISPVLMEERERPMIPVSLYHSGPVNLYDVPLERPLPPVMSPNHPPVHDQGPGRPRTPMRIKRRKEKPVSCPDCKMKFPYKADMTRHQNDIHKTAGITRHSCEQCPKAYKRRDHLLRHRTKKHGRQGKKMKRLQWVGGS